MRHGIRANLRPFDLQILSLNKTLKLANSISFQPSTTANHPPYSSSSSRKTMKESPAPQHSKCQCYESGRRPRLSLFGVLIHTQPAGPATDLRCVPVTRHGATVRRRGDGGGRLDAFAVGVASAVTSDLPVSQLLLFRWDDIRKGKEIPMSLSNSENGDTHCEPNSTPMYLYSAQ